MRFQPRLLILLAIVLIFIFVLIFFTIGNSTVFVDEKWKRIIDERQKETNESIGCQGFLQKLQEKITVSVLLIDTKILELIGKSRCDQLKMYETPIEIATNSRKDLNFIDRNLFKPFFFISDERKDYFEFDTKPRRIIPKNFATEKFGNIAVPRKPFRFRTFWERSRLISCANITMNRKEIKKRLNPELASIELSKLRDLLIDYDMYPFISEGTLLGWYRECSIIPHTQDLDISVMATEYTPQFLEDIRSGTSSFKLNRRLGYLDALELTVSRKNGYHVYTDIFFMYRDKNKTGIDFNWFGGLCEDGEQLRFHFPLFEPFCSADLHGHLVWTTCKPEAVLVHEYGEKWSEDMHTGKYSWYASQFNVERNFKCHTARLLVLRRPPEPNSEEHEEEQSCPFRPVCYRHVLSANIRHKLHLLFSMVNKAIVLVFMFIFLVFMILNRKLEKFSREDRLCTQSEWHQNPTIKETSDLGSSYFISFGDIQKNIDWLYIPKIENINEKNEILMIVPSRTDNFGRRNVLRKTWMYRHNSEMMNEGRMKALFLVGVIPGDYKMKRLIMGEAKLYEDIIVVDLNDNYVGLTYKTISLLLYATSKAPKFQLIGKIDEDVMFFPDQLTSLIDQKIIDVNSLSLYGEIVEAGGNVNHDESKKWYVPMSSYKCSKYPSCLSGPFYLSTRKAALKILAATKHRNLISVEDVFVTGLLADDVGVSKKSLPMLYMLPEKITGEAENVDILAWHTLQSNEQYFAFFDKRLIKKNIKKLNKELRG